MAGNKISKIINKKLNKALCTITTIWFFKKFFAALLAFITVGLFIAFNIADTKTFEEPKGCNPYGATRDTSTYLRSHTADGTDGIVTHVEYKEISWFFGISHSTVLTIKLRTLDDLSKTITLQNDAAKANLNKFKPGDHVAITNDGRVSLITARAVESPCG